MKNITLQIVERKKEMELDFDTPIETLLIREGQSIPFSFMCSFEAFVRSGKTVMMTSWTEGSEELEIIKLWRNL